MYTWLNIKRIEIFEKKMVEKWLQRWLNGYKDGRKPLLIVRIYIFVRFPWHSSYLFIYLVILMKVNE